VIASGNLGEFVPQNWRRHPQNQTAAMQAMLQEVGWAGALIAYEHGDELRLIDGHLRAELTPDDEVPVLVLDVSEDEAKNYWRRSIQSLQVRKLACYHYTTAATNQSKAGVIKRTSVEVALPVHAINGIRAQSFRLQKW